MSATQLGHGPSALPRPRRRFASVILPMFLAVLVAAGIALTIMASNSGDATEKSGTSIDRPAHAPGPSGEQRPT